jgi:hypothetical protein
MKEFLWSFYFPTSRRESSYLLRSIEIIEESGVIPRLDYTTIGPGENFENRLNEIKTIKIENRLEWLNKTLETEESFFLNSGYKNKEALVELTVSSSFIEFRECLESSCVFNLRMNLTFTSQVYNQIINKISKNLIMHWGEISFSKTKTNLVHQIVRPHEKNRNPEYGLPIVKIPQFLNGPDIPFFIGWINYWSENTVEIVEFNQAKDSDLFYKIQHTDNGGIILQLTEEPLDLEIPEHLAALKKVYERFPKVGGRDTPFHYLK